MQNPIVSQLAAEYSARFGRLAKVQQGVIYDHAWYPSAGLAASAPLNFFAVGQGGKDPNDPRATSTGKTLERTNLGKTNQLDWHFVATELRTFVAYDPMKRQAAGISGDVDGCFSYQGWYSVMDELEDILRRGLLTIKANGRKIFETDQPFMRCPPGFGVTILEHAAADRYSQWTTQSPWAKTQQLLPFLQFSKLGTVDAMLTYPNAASPALTTAYTTGPTTPYLSMMLALVGFRIE